MTLRTEERIARWLPIGIALAGFLAAVVWQKRDLDQMQRQLQVVIDVTCDAHPESCRRLLAASASAAPSSLVSVTE